MKKNQEQLAADHYDSTKNAGQPILPKNDSSNKSIDQTTSALLNNPESAAQGSGEGCSFINPTAEGCTKTMKRVYEEVELSEAPAGKECKKNTLLWLL